MGCRFLKVRVMKKLVFLVLMFAGVAEAQVRELNLAHPSLTVDTAAYASGDTIGGLLSISDISCPGEMFEITGIQTIDDAGQSITRDFTFFKSQPSGTFTDNQPTAPTKADLILAAPPVQIASTDCFTYSGKAICSVSSLASSGRSTALFNTRRKLWLAITTRGADDFVLNSDFALKLFIRCL